MTKIMNFVSVAYIHIEGFEYVNSSHLSGCRAKILHILYTDGNNFRIDFCIGHTSRYGVRNYDTALKKIPHVYLLHFMDQVNFFRGKKLSSFIWNTQNSHLGHACWSNRGV